MATPWNSATAYSPGAVVSYNGLEYVRSKFPVTATSGTPPNEEMSVDTYGVDIRTWTLNFQLPAFLRFDTQYFRTAIPPLDEDLQPTYFFAGEELLTANAYDGVPSIYGPGCTAEFDQFRNNPGTIPDSPVCPSGECGVAMFQFGFPPKIETFITSGGDGNRTKYIFVVFNHPLYFRRSLTIATVIVKQVTPPFPDPVPPPVVDINYTNYVPDDRNYCDVDSLNNDYVIPANAAFSVVVPINTNNGGTVTTYTFGGAGLVSIEGGD